MKVRNEIPALILAGMLVAGPTVVGAQQQDMGTTNQTITNEDTTTDQFGSQDQALGNGQDQFDQPQEDQAFLEQDNQTARQEDEAHLAEDDQLAQHEEDAFDSQDGQITQQDDGFAEQERNFEQQDDLLGQPQESIGQQDDQVAEQQDDQFARQEREEFGEQDEQVAQADRQDQADVTVTSETIRDAQQALRTRGYDVGPVDGIMGPNTRQALEEFQQDRGLQSTGQLDSQTMAQLNVQSDQVAQAQDGDTSDEEEDTASADERGNLFDQDQPQ